MSGGRIISVSADQSQISTDITNPAADGVAVTNVYVTAKQNRADGDGDALPVADLAAEQCVITVTPSTGVTITQPATGATQGGQYVGSFVSTNAATVSVGASILGQTVTGNATVVVGGGDPVDPPSGDPFFTDDFVGTQKNNDNGFVWGGVTSAVTVVSFDTYNCLRFRYGPNAAGVDASAEQRFALGRDCAELWLEYYLHVPSNYSHRNESPGNNKFLMLWKDTYGSNSGTWQCGYEYTTNASFTPNSRVRAMSSKEFGDLYLYVTDVGPDNGTAMIGGTGPIAKNAWNQIRVHAKRSSADGATDGVLEMWVGGVLEYQATGAFRNSAGGEAVLKNGYFFGWSNSGFTDETDFHIRNVKFYDTDPGW